MIAPERIVLDTSAYASFGRGDREVFWLIRDAALVFVPVTVIGELEAGFARSARMAQNERALSEFLAKPFVEVLEVTIATARHYGRICAALRRAGKPVPVNDTWIAAAALDCGGTLVTLDRDFLRVEGLEVALLSVD